jgi:hypothetical protein
VDDKGNCLFDRSVDMQPIQYTDVKDSKNSVKEGKEGVLNICLLAYIHVSYV